MPHVEWIFAIATGILACAWMVCRFSRMRPASQDHVWRTALVAVALTPAIVLLRGSVAEWQLALPILPVAQADIPEHPSAEVASPEFGDDSSSRTLLADEQRGALSETHRLPAASPGEIEFNPSENSSVALSQTIGDELAVSSIPATSLASWKLIVGFVCLAGCGVYCVRIGRGAWIAHKLVRGAVSVMDGDVLELNAWCAERVGLRSPGRIVASPRIDSPVVSGLLSAKIVVPPGLLGSEARAQLRAALLHENGHVRRHDIGFDLLLKLVTAAMWFHPLVYLMGRELRRLREEMCDNYVLAQEPAVNYAELLLQLAVGKRLAETSLMGLGMFARRHRLEARVEALLSPSRSLATRAPQSTRWLVLSAACFAVLAMAVVRFEAAAAEPPIAAESAPQSEATAPTKIAAAPPVEAKPANNEAATPKAPREYTFRIVDTNDKPVVGASLTPWGIAAASSGPVTQPPGMKSIVLKSDEQGIVRLVFTQEMETAADGLLKFPGVTGIMKLGLKVDHPDHPVWSDYFDIAADRPIVLADATTIVVRARRTNDATLAQRLYPELTSAHTVDFSEADGVLTVRRIQLSGQKATRWLRIAQVPEHGPAWFGEPVDLRHIGGDPITLETTLSPGVRVEGRLGDEVPRPVKNGRVVAASMRRAEGSGGLLWQATAEIAADGTFVLESFPAGDHLQLIAVCDGWVSRSPSLAEGKAYEAEHGLPFEEWMAPSAGSVYPRLHRLQGAVIKPIVPMDATTSSEVTVVDTKGQPIADVHIQFMVNQFIRNSGTGTIGMGRDDATYIRARLATGADKPSDQTAEMEKRIAQFSAKTNAKGVAVVSGLPAPPIEPDANRQIQFMAFREGYAAVSNFPVSDESPMPVLVATLSAGKMERVKISMNAVGAAGKPGAGSAATDAPPAVPGTEIFARVVDDQGQPIEGVEVRLCNEDCFKIRTDEDGRFHYKFDEPMFEPGDVPLLPVRFIKAGYAPIIAELHMDDRDQLVTLLSNTYFEGTVRGVDGKPAANVLIRGNQWANYLRNPVGDYIWTETRSDADGHYKLLAQSDMYVIAASAPTGEMAWLPKFERKHEGPERPRIYIAPTEVKHLDIQLEPGVDFQVNVIDSLTGEPVREAELFQRDFPGAMGKTDDTGSLTIRGLPAGSTMFNFYSKWHVRAWSHEASKAWKAEIEKISGSASPMVSVHDGMNFDLTPGMAPVTITLEPPVRITGKLLDPDGNPVPGAAVERARAPRINALNKREQYVYADKDGKFSLLLPPSDGRPYHLIVHDDRNAANARKWANGVGAPFETTAGQTIENVELRLSRPGIIRGRVVDGRGKPLAAVHVQSTSLDQLERDRFNPSTESGRDGTFELRNVRPGRHLVHGRKPIDDLTAAKAFREVEVKVDETATVGDVIISIDDDVER